MSCTVVSAVLTTLLLLVAVVNANHVVFSYDSSSCGGSPGQFVKVEQPTCSEIDGGTSQQYTCRDDDRFYSTVYTSDDCTGTGTEQVQFISYQDGLFRMTLPTVYPKPHTDIVAFYLCRSPMASHHLWLAKAAISPTALPLVTLVLPRSSMLCWRCTKTTTAMTMTIFRT